LKTPEAELRENDPVAREAELKNLAQPKCLWDHLSSLGVGNQSGRSTHSELVFVFLSGFFVFVFLVWMIMIILLCID
jgi:hypothetical protein